MKITVTYVPSEYKLLRNYELCDHSHWHCYIWTPEWL